MKDARVAAIAGRQFNRISRAQLHQAGLTANSIAHRVAAGRLVIVEQGVFAVAPVLDDDWGRWMGAALTAPGTDVSHLSAAAARGWWSGVRRFETVTRSGSGGPRRHGGVLVFHRVNTAHSTRLRGVPITTSERTLLDIAPMVTDAALARCVREAVRLGDTTVAQLSNHLTTNRRRRGGPRLAAVLDRYTGLPLQRARSGAEIRAMEVLRHAGVELPRLNVRVADEEADLSWPRRRLIIEIDGGPFHLDVGEDARKQSVWEDAGWVVLRIPSDAVYDDPGRLVGLASSLIVHR